MKIFIIVSLFFVLPKAFADFDRAIFKNSQMMEDSEVVEDEKVKLNCFVYKRYLVLEKDEPGFLGKNLYFKENSLDKKVAPENFCKDLKMESFKKLQSSGSSFYGMFRRFLFVQDPDELSARTKFEIYNLESGQMTYSGIKNNNTLMKIIPITAKKTAIEYFQRYQVDCDFNSEKMNLKCWNDFLATIEVPKDVKVPYPSCPKSKTPKKFQVFLKILVPDIQKTKRNFLWAKPICEIAP